MKVRANYIYTIAQTYLYNCQITQWNIFGIFFKINIRILITKINDFCKKIISKLKAKSPSLFINVL
jgi:hypothetical protein